MSVHQKALALFHGEANKNRALQERWIRAGYASIGVPDFMRHQGDYLIDMLLRSMEDEAKAVGLDDETVTMSMTLQFTLSRSWLLNTYELLRTALDTSVGRANADLKSLHDDIKLVRVPLTKLEIADDRWLDEAGLELVRTGDDADAVLYTKQNKLPYYPPTVFNPDLGSIGWKVVEIRKGERMRERELFRRELSNRLIDLLDPRGRSGREVGSSTEKSPS